MPPFRGEFCDKIWHQKTRIVGLPDGEEIMTLAFFVLTQYRHVTETDRQTRCYREGSNNTRSQAVARIADHTASH